MKIRSVLLFSVLLIVGCSQTYFGAPDDFVNWHNEEEQQQLIVECDTLIHLNDTAFTTITIWFINGKPEATVYKKGSDGTTTQVQADSLYKLIKQDFPQYKYTEYQSDVAVTVFIDGTNNSEQFQNKYWARDVIGQKAFATAFGQRFYPFGSMTFEEEMYESSHRKNILAFHFRNTNYTPEQYNALARSHMRFAECKHGEERALFWGATGIAQSIIDSSFLYLWDDVQVLDVPELIKA